MYPFVRNGIYSRAYRAYEYYLKAKMISNSIELSDLSVHGETFIIKREGGGRIGVFVPIRIDLLNGNSIPIDPKCFENDIDVKTLLQSGMI